MPALFLIAEPGDTTPYVEWLTRVTYPAGHVAHRDGHVYEFQAGDDRAMAERRRVAHLERGAASAVIVSRVWTPSVWAEDSAADESTEFEVRWHGSDDEAAIRLDERAIQSLEHAYEVGPTKVGLYGITRWTVWQRTHRSYPDGSTWIGPWQRCPSVGQELDPIGGVRDGR